MMLSAHFSLEELTHSDTAIRKGIDNTPSNEVSANLGMLAQGLERVRSILDCPMRISSGYRCPKLNAAIGGSATSQHMSGEAADFTAPDFGSPLEIAREIVNHKDSVVFDQLIYEGSWVHISFSDNPRGEVLTATFVAGKATYRKGLT